MSRAKFQVGDRVKVVKVCDGNESIVGMTGVILLTDSTFPCTTEDKFKGEILSCLVQFDEQIVLGHDGFDEAGKKTGAFGFCWYCSPRVLVKEKREGKKGEKK